MSPPLCPYIIPFSHFRALCPSPCNLSSAIKHLSHAIKGRDMALPLRECFELLISRRSGSHEPDKYFANRNVLVCVVNVGFGESDLRE